MDRPDVIQLGSLEHEIDAQAASHLICPEGKVLVEMLPAHSSIHGLLLPERVAENLRPDVGIVLACGPGVSLDVGDMVAVRGYDGQWLTGFDAGGYATPHQVRCYGKCTRPGQILEEVPWQESIPIVLLPAEDSMVATHNNLIVRRDPPARREGILELADSSCYRTGLAEVLSVGPACRLSLGEREVEVGDRIHYDTTGELEFAFGGDPELAVIPDLAVNFVIED